MSDLTTQRFFARTRITKTAGIPLRLTTVVACLLLTIVPLLTGCGGGEQTGGEPSGVTASLTWSPVQNSSIIGYFVHYGRQSPNQSGSCAYESSIFVDSPSGTVTNLDPNTLYYFTVSAYNGLESACSDEVSAVTDPPSSEPIDRTTPPLPPPTDVIGRG